MTPSIISISRLPGLPQGYFLEEPHLPSHTRYAGFSLLVSIIRSRIAVVFRSREETTLSRAERRQGAVAITLD